MTEYTSLKKADIEDILSRYGFTDVDSWSILSGGWTNTNYLVRTNQGQVILTIIEQKTFDESVLLARLLEFLDENNFSTTRLFRDADINFVSTWKNKPLMVKTFVEGHVVENLSGQLLSLIGAEMGKLHLLAIPDFVPERFSYEKDFFDTVAEYEPQSDFYEWLLDVRRYIDEHISNELPLALIHSDIFFNNVIISADEKQATIMDFEEASRYYRVLDIGMSIVGLCCPGEKLDTEKAKSLLKGYQEKIQLEPEELRALQAFTVYAAAAVSFWRHRQYRFKHPDKDMRSHYLSMQELADDVRSMPNGEFMKIVETWEPAK